MIVNADLHIHSRFAAATSNKMTIEKISLEAPRKGIQMVATGDCLHPGWMKEIKQCRKVEEGTFELNNTRFILSTEIEAKKRVHHLLYFPSISKVEEFKTKIKPNARKLDTDGRPSIDMHGEKLATIAKDLDILIGPAHAFTPWTAMYAYYDSLDECYGDLADYVSFLELGLSADSNYADKIKELHRLTFLSNSDCHSPHPVRLAREFNRFNLKDATFAELKKAILRKNDNKPLLNVGLPPKEGKYNESACRSCYTHYTLQQAKRRRWKCTCGKSIKKGVKDRIKELSDFKKTQHPSHRPQYIHLIPLAEIIAKAVGQKSTFTKTVSKRWNELVNAFQSEINVLLDVPIEDISHVTAPDITQAIQAFREKKVTVKPGGGGEYGKIILPEEKTISDPLTPNKKQMSLTDY